MTGTQLLLTDAPAVDPHAEHRALIEATIRQVAARDGYVSPNAVRALLPADPHGLVGQTYRRLRRAGHLVPLGMERSNDVRSGNGGRLVETFRWVETP